MCYNIIYINIYIYIYIYKLIIINIQSNFDISDSLYIRNLDNHLYISYRELDESK